MTINNIFDNMENGFDDFNENIIMTDIHINIKRIKEEVMQSIKQQKHNVFDIYNILKNKK